METDEDNKKGKRREEGRDFHITFFIPHDKTVPKRWMENGRKKNEAHGSRIDYLKFD